MNAITKAAPAPRIDEADPPGGDPFVYTWPYYAPVRISDVMAPAIDNYLTLNLPIILPPYIDPAAEAAVQAIALLKAGDTATGPIYTTELLPTADAEFATKLYVDTVAAGVPAFPEAPADGAVFGRMGSNTSWQPVLALAGGTMVGTLNAAAVAVSGWLTTTFNSSTMPPPVGSYGSFAWNATGGNAEVDYFNDTTTPTISHRFWQRTATTPAPLLDIGPTGALRAYGPIIATGWNGVLRVYEDLVDTSPAVFTADGYMMGQDSRPGVAPIPLCNFSQILIHSDSLDAFQGGTSGPGGASYLYIGASIGDLNPPVGPPLPFTGHRNGVNCQMTVEVTPGATAINNFMTAIVGWSIANVPDNGGNNNVFGAQFMAALNENASGWGSMAAMELDLECRAGASVNIKEGLKIVLADSDEVQGTVDDNALVFVNQINHTTAGWRLGISFGNSTGTWPMSPTGTMIGTQPGYQGPANPTPPAYQCAWGIDFSAVTFTQGAFRSPNFQVHQSGGIAFGGSAANDTDLTRHVDLFGQVNGMNYVDGNVRILVGSGGVLAFDIGGTNVGYYGSDGLHAALAAPTFPNGATVNGGWLETTFNASGVNAPAANGGALGWNLGGGTAEVDYVNTYLAPETSHTFWQRTGVATQARLMDIDPAGNCNHYGAIRIAGPAGPTWYSGDGLPLAIAPGGSLYSRTDGAVGSTLYVSAGAGIWNAVAGV
ncbi:MAG TPA: hypothetical protein VIY51_21385 [Xanthobacteraceae bacterium]